MPLFKVKEVSKVTEYSMIEALTEEEAIEKVCDGYGNYDETITDSQTLYYEAEIVERED